MAPPQILMMDLDPHKCPEDHTRQLIDMIRDSLNARVINLQSVTRFPPHIDSPPPDLVVLRSANPMNLPEAVQSVRKRWNPVSILGLFCFGEVTPAVVLQCLHNGLDDFLTCPFRDIEVCPRVQRLLRSQGDAAAPQQSGEIKAPLPIEGLVGESRPFRQVLHLVLDVAHTDATVLISGETGTGKELIARAIHYQSARQRKPFIPVNCGALPDHLVENELFGHVRGAYTDASSPEKGLVAEAETGTLFLDEVDTLSPAAQVKLLRFLQDREYRPLGSANSHTADVRIIAATNADLLQQVQAHRLREDLYYRLNIIALHLPPLRERTEDIPLLASHFLHRYAHHYGRASLRLSVDALHKLVMHGWPGNVRELETVIQRAVILTSSPVIQPADVDLPGLPQSTVSKTDSFRQAKTRVIEQFERTYLSNLLAAHGGNITHAAKEAGEARRSLHRLLKKYDLNRRSFQA